MKYPFYHKKSLKYSVEGGVRVFSGSKKLIFLFLYKVN